MRSARRSVRCGSIRPRAGASCPNARRAAQALGEAADRAAYLVDLGVGRATRTGVVSSAAPRGARALRGDARLDGSCGRRRERRPPRRSSSVASASASASAAVAERVAQRAPRSAGQRPRARAPAPSCASEPMREEPELQAAVRRRCARGDPDEHEQAIEVRAAPERGSRAATRRPRTSRRARSAAREGVELIRLKPLRLRGAARGCAAHGGGIGARRTRRTRASKRRRSRGRLHDDARDRIAEGVRGARGRRRSDRATTSIACAVRDGEPLAPERPEKLVENARRRRAGSPAADRVPMSRPRAALLREEHADACASRRASSPAS